MKMPKRAAILLASFVLAACGGGGGSAGTAPFGGGGPPPASAAAAVDVKASPAPVLGSSDQITITAIVKDANNVILPAGPVVFAKDDAKAILTSNTTVTDMNGAATATLSAGSDKSNHLITITVTSGSASGKLAIKVQAPLVDVVASAVQVGSGGDQVTISAFVKDAGNATLPGAPVRIATDSGVLSNPPTMTDASGVATALLSAGPDKSNRTINVTVESGPTTAKIAVDVVGTTLAYSGVTTVKLGAKVSVSVKATDSKGAVIGSGQVIKVTSSLANGLSAASATTDAQGSATVDYTATHSGTDTLSFTGAGASTTASVQISAADFAFLTPAAAANIPVATARPVTVRYLSNGVPQSGRTVNFAATAGIVSPPSALTDLNGIAATSITSATASPATIQATLVGVAAQATLPVVFVATTPAKVVLQIQPTAIGPNPGGATAQQAQILATVTDANGNPVAGTTIDFNRLADPSGGDLSQASNLTDTSGQATVQYIAGALTTASNGVQIRATVSGSPSIFGDAMLTVNQSALFIAIGTGNTISNIDEQTYKKDYVVYVTDANGVAVPSITLTIKVLPVQYGKGFLTFQGTVWDYAPAPGAVVFCPNEDVNYNGVIDGAGTAQTEDTNGSGHLDPGNVISVTTSTSTTVASTGTVTTDTSGRATISLIYAESYARWVTVTLRAEAVVTGTESSKESTFTVVGSSPDFTSPTIPPAAQFSPFGAQGCALPN